MELKFVLNSLIKFLIFSCATVALFGQLTPPSGGGAVLACVGTPGNTTGSYRSICQTSGGLLYACNNASGCTVAANWVSQGGTATALGFDAVTTGANTTATMTVGTGGTLTYSGTGIINASKILGTTLTSLTGIAKLTAGVPSVAAGADVPAVGSSGQIPYNNGSSIYAADSGLAYNSGTNALGVKGTVSSGSSGGATGIFALNGSTSGIATITTNSTGAAIVFDKPIASNAGLTLGQTGGTIGSAAFNGNTSGTVTVQPAATAGTWTLTLPTTAGTDGYVLKTNGSGVTSWVAQAGGSSAWSALTVPTGNLSLDNSTYTTDFTGTGRFTFPLLGVGMAADPATAFEVSTTLTTSPRGIMSSQYDAGTNGARLHMRKARGTRASPTVVVTGDTLGRLVGSGYDGSNYLEMASIDFVSSGTIASTRVPTEIRFYTATNATPSVLTQRMTIDSSGAVGIGIAPNASYSLTLAAGISIANGIALNNAGVLRNNGNSLQLEQQIPGKTLNINGYSNGAVNAVAFMDNSTVRAIIDTNGNFVVGTGSAGATLDVTKTNTLTARFYDQTATTGTTRVAIRAGAGDAAGDLLLNQTLNDGTTSKFSVTRDGTATAIVHKGGHSSADGSAGVTVTTCTSFKDGLCVAGT